MPIYVLLFNGGLKIAEKPTKKVGGVQYYGIDQYRDLDHLLGINWHVRGINSQGDYGYAVTYFSNVIFHMVKLYRSCIVQVMVCDTQIVYNITCDICLKYTGY